MHGMARIHLRDSSNAILRVLLIAFFTVYRQVQTKNHLKKIIIIIKKFKNQFSEENGNIGTLKKSPGWMWTPGHPLHTPDLKMDECK